MNVWFRIPPGVAAAETGDAFLAVALIPAMALGAALDLTALPPVSSELLGRLGDIQDIWTSWNPLMQRIDVRANQRPSSAATMSGGAAFFSGGVDALFTALERRADLDQLVFINGFDFNMSAEVFANARARVARQAALLGMPLVAVETNWIDFTRRHRIARTTSYGGVLAGVALLLAPERMVIAFLIYVRPVGAQRIASAPRSALVDRCDANRAPRLPCPTRRKADGHREASRVPSGHLGLSSRSGQELRNVSQVPAAAVVALAVRQGPACLSRGKWGSGGRVVPGRPRPVRTDPSSRISPGWRTSAVATTSCDG